ncbi:MAG: hypothetical protein JWQ00_31, partial [Noviherbaspirillum sp.]|nr:hypothetical protein [Noviherbaspirillum sp.]
KESGLPEMAIAIGLMTLRVASRERLERAWVKASV